MMKTAPKFLNFKGLNLPVLMRYTPRSRVWISAAEKIFWEVARCEISSAVLSIPLQTYALEWCLGRSKGNVLMIYRCWDWDPLQCNPTIAGKELDRGSSGIV
jgi:hypothetical protein